jgi:hypothetical protein
MVVVRGPERNFSRPFKRGMLEDGNVHLMTKARVSKNARAQGRDGNDSHDCRLRHLVLPTFFRTV